MEHTYILRWINYNFITMWILLTQNTKGYLMNWIFGRHFFSNNQPIPYKIIDTVGSFWDTFHGNHR